MGALSTGSTILLWVALVVGVVGFIYIGWVIWSTLEGWNMANYNLTSGTCSVCKQKKGEENIVWHFGGMIGCKQCADRWFHEAILRERRWEVWK